MRKVKARKDFVTLPAYSIVNNLMMRRNISLNDLQLVNNKRMTLDKEEGLDLSETSFVPLIFFQ